MRVYVALHNEKFVKYLHLVVQETCYGSRRRRKERRGVGAEETFSRSRGDDGDAGGGEGGKRREGRGATTELTKGVTIPGLSRCGPSRNGELRSAPVENPRPSDGIDAGVNLRRVGGWKGGGKGGDFRDGETTGNIDRLDPRTRRTYRPERASERPGGVQSTSSSLSAKRRRPPPTTRTTKPPKNHPAIESISRDLAILPTTLPPKLH